MGRVFIPEAVFTHQVLPFESLIRGLAEALQPHHRRQEGDSACRRQTDASCRRRQEDDSTCRRQCDDSASKRQCEDQKRGCMFNRAQFGCPGFTPWFYTSVQLGRYRAPEVSVNVENGIVVLHARREERHGDDLDLSEARRSVKLPPGVDQRRVLCFLRPDGRVIIKAPLVDKKGTEQSPQEKTASKEAAQSQKDTRSEEATEAKIANSKSEESTINVGYDEKTPENVSNLYTTKTADADASNFSTTDEKPADTEAVFDKKEAADQDISVAGIFQDSFAVNTDDEIDIEEHGAEKEILDEDENVSLAPSDDFLIVDNTAVETDEHLEQDTEMTETDIRDEPKPDPSDADQELRPLADSVRIIEDGHKKKFEVSLNLKDFDAGNMSVRFVENELFVDAKKELTDGGSYSLHEVHRKYAVPEAGILDSARAQITGDGMVTVTVPLETEEKVEQITVPIVQLE